VLMGCHRLFQFVFEYPATLHDELYPLKFGDVGVSSAWRVSIVAGPH